MRQRANKQDLPFEHGARQLATVGCQCHSTCQHSYKWLHTLHQHAMRPFTTSCLCYVADAGLGSAAQEGLLQPPPQLRPGNSQARMRSRC